MVEFSRKRRITVAAVLLLVVLLEVYAHSYVQVHAISVVPEEEADKLWASYGPYVGSYRFTQGNCIWFVKWMIEKPTSHSSYAWVRIFKVWENTSFLTSPASIAVSSVKKAAEIENFECFFDVNRDVLYEGNSTYVRLELHFGENGYYPINLNLTVNFYHPSLIGIIPAGEVTIPINGTVVTNIKP
jgi:hypothetical protein